MNKIKRALISVWDKKGIIELANFLFKNNIEIISTGGTKTTIEKSGIPVISVSKITKQKEIMDGRVKTLHPMIFGGILADRNNKKHILDLEKLDCELFDLIVINLYPFKEEAINKKLELEKSIEYIDIGGPSLLRASAKNYQHVVPLCKPDQYSKFIKEYKENGEISLNSRINYASSVFSLVSNYNQEISNYFKNKEVENNNKKNMFENNENYNVINLRYGENPHQKANFYHLKSQTSVINQLHGKELSYNNYFDIESAITIAYEFEENACAIIKHANPCGFGISNNNKDAYLNAVSTDPVSYFGGIVAFNTLVDSIVAEEISKSFLECIVAPVFSENALNILKKKKNLRLITISKEILNQNITNYDIKTVFNGFLTQTRDSFIKKSNEFEIVSKRKPNNNEFISLLLGWKLVKFVKSNAIVFTNHEKLLGVGAGQMSRVDSVKIAIKKSLENGLNLNGSIMASDAFFPFSDSIKLAKEAGAVGIIHPGGSIKDNEIIEAVNDLNLIMVLTKERHFYH